jgi:hypothetical protein
VYIISAQESQQHPVAGQGQSQLKNGQNLLRWKNQITTISVEYKYNYSYKQSNLCLQAYSTENNFWEFTCLL